MTKKHNIKEYVIKSLKGSLICRALAAWLVTAGINICKYPGFDVIYWQNNINIVTDIIIFAVSFLAFSVICAFCGKIHSDSTALFFAALFCSVSAACRKSEFVFLLAVLIAMTLTAINFVTKNEELLSRFAPSKRLVNILTLAMTCVCFLMIASIGVFRYKTFGSPNYDFGIFVNMFYNMKERGLPVTTCERNELLSHFAVHFSPIWYVLLPIYFVFPYAETLAAAQGAILAIGAVPVLLIARENKLSERSQLFAVAVYCFSPLITAGTAFDIHENCFLAPLLLWMIYFYEKKKYPLFLIFAFSVMLVKEDAAFYILIFALYIIICDKNYLWGIISADAAVLYFVFAVYFMEKYGTGIMSSRFDNLIADSADGLFGALKTVIKDPAYVLGEIFKTRDGNAEKIQYLIYILVPVGFISLCTKKSSRWLLSAPMLVNLITDYPYQYQISYQYHFGIVALSVYALIKNIKEIPKSVKRVLCTVAAVGCIVLYTGDALPSVSYYVGAYSGSRDIYVEVEAALDEIPHEASVCASAFIVPHIADRDEIYEIEYHDFVPDTDYVVIDERYARYTGDVQTYLSLGYTVEKDVCGFIVIMKKTTG